MESLSTGREENLISKLIFALIFALTHALCFLFWKL
jgi:hypothetical protein